jgi:hypothetical protein
MNAHLPLSESSPPAGSVEVVAAAAAAFAFFALRLPRLILLSFSTDVDTCGAAISQSRALLLGKDQHFAHVLKQSLSSEQSNVSSLL